MNVLMKQLCEDYLHADHINRGTGEGYDSMWNNDQSASNLFWFLFGRILFNEDYHPFIEEIRAKRIESLTLKETEIYLTGAAAADRVWGAYSGIYSDGTLDNLIKHWLLAAKRAEPKGKADIEGRKRIARNNLVSKTKACVQVLPADELKRDSSLSQIEDDRRGDDAFRAWVKASCEDEGFLVREESCSEIFKRCQGKKMETLSDYEIRGCITYFFHSTVPEYYISRSTMIPELRKYLIRWLELNDA